MSVTTALFLTLIHYTVDQSVRTSTVSSYHLKVLSMRISFIKFDLINYLAVYCAISILNYKLIKITHL